MTNTENTKPQLITPPNTLKDKVSMGGPNAIDPDVLEKAEQIIADMADDYSHWVREDIERLNAAFEMLSAEGGATKENMDAVFEIAHDMKGQGGSFGYDLITAIGHELCRFLENVEKYGPSEVQAVKVHIDAIKRVIADDMKGDGGLQGGHLLTGLQMVRQKLIKE